MTDTVRPLIDGGRDLFAALAAIVVPISVVGAIALRLAFDDAIVERDSAGAVTGLSGFSSVDAGLALGTLVLGLLSSSAVFATATVHLARVSDSVSWSGTLRRGVARSPRVVGVVLAQVALVFACFAVAAIAFLAGAGVGALALIAALVASIAVLVRTATAATRAVMKRPGFAIVESVRATSGHGFGLLGRFVLLVSIVVSFQLVGAIVALPFPTGASGPPSDPAADLAVSDLLGTNLPALIGSQVVTALAQAFATAFWAGAMLRVDQDLSPSNGGVNGATS